MYNRNTNIVMNEQLYEILRPFAKMVAEEILAMQKPQPQEKETEQSRTLKGLNGIMEIFQCSKSKASRIKASGIIDSAITTTGRMFIVDERKALEAMNRHKGGRRYAR